MDDFDAGVQKFMAHLKSNAPKALEQIMDAAEAKAKTLVPVDSGRLLNSIHHEQVEQDSGGVSSRLVAGGGDVDYAGYVEAGTEKMSPQPFMGPAKEHAKKVAPAIFKQELGGRS